MNKQLLAVAALSMAAGVASPLGGGNLLAACRRARVDGARRRRSSASATPCTVQAKLYADFGHDDKKFTEHESGYDVGIIHTSWLPHPLLGLPPCGSPPAARSSSARQPFESRTGCIDSGTTATRHQARVIPNAASAASPAP